MQTHIQNSNTIRLRTSKTATLYTFKTATLHDSMTKTITTTMQPLHTLLSNRAASTVYDTIMEPATILQLLDATIPHPQTLTTRNGLDERLIDLKTLAEIADRSHLKAIRDKYQGRTRTTAKQIDTIATITERRETGRSAICVATRHKTSDFTNSPNSVNTLLLNSKYPSSMLQQKRTVQFRSIEILEFAYTVGDNPSVSSGVPLSSEWAPQRKTILPLCVFETHRPTRSRECAGPRRFSSRRREKILLRNGCSIKDMTAAARDVVRIQKERAFTKHQLYSRRLGSCTSNILGSTCSILAEKERLIKKPHHLSDASPMLPQRRSSQLNSSTTTIDFPSSPVTTLSGC
jgi:hypothetical protein